ncbi:MAG: hypothetical protein V2A34_13950, partial [Lentisphaerota bacterium]
LAGHEPGSGSDTQMVMTVTNDAVLTWLWTTNYLLNVTAGPHGSALPAPGWQPYGSNVTLTATADPYFKFINWTGDTERSSNPLNLLMDGPKALTANFHEILTTNHPTPQWWLAQHGLVNFEEEVELDADEDGVPTGDEWVMNTDPTNGASYLHWSALEGVGEPESPLTAFVLSWPCATDRLYDVQYDPSDLLGWMPVDGMTNIAPNADWMVVTNALDGGAIKFYRLKVRLP